MLRSKAQRRPIRRTYFSAAHDASESFKSLSSASMKGNFQCTYKLVKNSHTGKPVPHHRLVQAQRWTDYQDARHPSVAIAVCRHSENRAKNQPVACYLTRETARRSAIAQNLSTALSFSVECSICALANRIPNHSTAPNLFFRCPRRVRIL